MSKKTVISDIQDVKEFSAASVKGKMAPLVKILINVISLWFDKYLPYKKIKKMRRV